jgi:transketolase
VFTYSIGNFPLLRCLEQIRNDICYHRANVKIVSVGGGLAYGSLGMSHHATEDLAIARALPNLLVVAPNDPSEAEAATRALAAHDGPCYFRLGRAGEKRLFTDGSHFALGKAVEVRPGRDLALIAGGGMLGVALEAASQLTASGLSVRVVGIHTIKPIDEAMIRRVAQETRAIFTIEEHSRIGGLGSAVSEVLMESTARPEVFARFGLDDSFVSIAGSQDYLRSRFGLDASGVLRRVLALMPSTVAITTEE